MVAFLLVISLLAFDVGAAMLKRLVREAALKNRPQLVDARLELERMWLGRTRKPVLHAPLVWTRMGRTPGTARRPQLAVAMLTMHAMELGDMEVALLILLMVETYCCPGEVLLHAFEEQVPSKTQEFDQRAVLNLPRHETPQGAMLRFVLCRWPLGRAW